MLSRDTKSLPLVDNLQFPLVSYSVGPTPCCIPSQPPTVHGKAVPA
jgi:hypothetical protein